MNKSRLILVTGGNGFIGRATTRELLANGYDVRVLDKKPSLDPLPEVDYLTGDIEDKQMVQKAVRSVHGIIHAAAMSRSGPSNLLWDEAVTSNIIGTSNMLHAAKNEGVKKFVYCGSSTYYGNQSGPQNENLPPNLLNVYGVTKYTGEQFTKIFDEYFDLPTITLRYFNVYGDGQPESESEGLVIGIFLRAKRNGRSVVLEGGGLQTRDFVEVRDVARANLLALECSTRNRVINIGSGKKTSILDLTRILDLEFTIGKPRDGDATTTEANIESAKKILNWEPRISLSEGLQDLLDSNDSKIERL